MSRDGDELASTSMIFSICMFVFFFFAVEKKFSVARIWVIFTSSLTCSCPATEFESNLKSSFTCS